MAQIGRSIGILGLLVSFSSITVGCGGDDDDNHAAAGTAGSSGTAGTTAGSSGTAGTNAGTAGTAGTTAGTAGTTAGTAGTTAGTAGTAGTTAGTSGTSGTAGSTAACTPMPLTVGAVTVGPNGYLTATVSVEGAGADTFQIELYAGVDDPPTPLAAGTFDLATAPDDNYATCMHCVTLRTDADASTGAFTLTYFQESGSITLDTVGNPPNSASKGSITNVKLIEVLIDPDTYESTPVGPGSLCYSIASLTWDTMPVNGTPCVNAEDCSNPAAQICDLATLKCALPQCDVDTPCSMGSTCVSQSDNAVGGVCLKQCAPFTSGACDAGQECQINSVGGTSGLCLPVGTGASGATCTPSDTSTACVAGNSCIVPADATAGTCQVECSIFNTSVTCAAGSTCSYQSSCSTTAGDTAALGATCVATADNPPCGKNGSVYEGVCVGLDANSPTVLTCLDLCRLEGTHPTDCPASNFCANNLGLTEVGNCMPNPVCGNGTVEAGNGTTLPSEACDDHNTMPGDGCSATCQVEYPFYCASVPTLMLGANAGNTTTGSAVFTGSCGGGGNEKLYKFTAPSAGTLHLVLSSTADLGVYALDACSGTASEVGDCTDLQPGGMDETVDITLTSGQVITVIVDGYTSTDASAYTLTASFN